MNFDLTTLTSLLSGDSSAVQWIIAGIVLDQILNFVTPLSNRVTAASNAFFRNPIIVEGIEALETAQQAAKDGKFTPVEAKAVIKEMNDAAQLAIAKVRESRGN